MSAAECPQQKAFHKWLVTHMMPIVMVSLFPSALRTGNPHKHSRIPVRSLFERINVSLLNRAHTLRGESVAFRCLINDTCHVNLFSPQTKARSDEGRA